VLTQTLSDGLVEYQIGPKLRALRLRKKMGLVELGRHTGLSPALLSKVERGRIFPTLPTLLRIALVFGVGLDHFFVRQDDPPPAVVRRKDRLRFPARAGARRPPYHFESLDFPATGRALSGYFVEFETVDPADQVAHRHPGGELIYVTSGRLAVAVGNAEYVLDAGDSMYLRGDQPHSYRKLGARRSTAVVVTAGQNG
jgi:transcriptional regulator with XRE-family HTH domain